MRALLLLILCFLVLTTGLLTPAGIACAGPDATGQITGAVTGPDGTTPLPGIRVWVYQQTGPTTWSLLMPFVYTGADGRYVKDGLPSGVYRVYFSDSAGFYRAEYYNDKLLFDYATNFTVTDGAITSGIDASLAGAGRIAGTLTSGIDGSFVTDFRSYAWRLAGSVWESVGNATSGPNGQYVIGGLTAGAYRVQFRDLYFPARYADEWYFNVPSRDMAVDVMVTVGETRTGVDAVLNGSGSVQGKVTGPDGLSPAVGVQVDLYQDNPIEESWQWVNGALTPADGAYSIVALGGTYRVTFTDPGATPYFVPETYNDMPDIDSGNDVIVVADGSPTTGIEASLALYALPPAPIVTLTPSGASAGLSWPPVGTDTAGKPVTIQRYEVWHSASAYFAIGDEGATRADSPVPSFSDTNALTTPRGRFYLVRALTDRGGYSPASNKTAKFTFALVPGGQ